MGLVEKAFKLAKRHNKRRRLEVLRLQGADRCRLCGEEVPVYKDDEWSDIFNRLQKHAHERDDHVKQNGEWVYLNGE